MATYSSHRLKIGKEEIDNFLSHWGYLGFFFTEILIEKFSTFHIGERLIMGKVEIDSFCCLTEDI